MSDPNCLFCKIVAATSRRLASTRTSGRSLHGHQPGHARAPAGHPREHAADLLEIGAEDLAACARPRSGCRAREGPLGADGVNLVNSCGQLAWQTVFHFHLHVIPRYSGDPLRLPWNPAPGDRDDIAAAARS